VVLLGLWARGRRFGLAGGGRVHEPLDVVGYASGHHGLHAAGVVADHAAERAAAMRGRVGVEGELVALGLAPSRSRTLGGVGVACGPPDVRMTEAPPAPLAFYSRGSPHPAATSATKPATHDLVLAMVETSGPRQANAVGAFHCKCRSGPAETQALRRSGPPR
jgi:hypothetical protein